MFDIGWGELLLIGIVALVAIGPKELPSALRSLGHWMGKIRKMASEFQSQFQDAMREAELADLKKEVDEMATTAQSYANYDPMADIRKDIENATGPLPDLNAPVSSSTDASASTPASSSAATDSSATPDAAPAASDAAAHPAPAEASAAPPSSPTTPSEPELPKADGPKADGPKSDGPKPDVPKPDAGRAA
jgi:sec-independent protein translocase protein TatB